MRGNQDSGISNGDRIAPPPPIARFMGPTWGPTGADRARVGPMNFAIWAMVHTFLILSTIHNITYHASSNLPNYPNTDMLAGVVNTISFFPSPIIITFIICKHSCFCFTKPVVIAWKIQNIFWLCRSLTIFNFMAVIKNARKHILWISSQKTCLGVFEWIVSLRFTKWYGFHDFWFLTITEPFISIPFSLMISHFLFSQLLDARNLLMSFYHQFILFWMEQMGDLFVLSFFITRLSYMTYRYARSFQNQWGTQSFLWIPCPCRPFWISQHFCYQEIRAQFE